MLSDVVALTREVAGTVRIGIIGTTARWLVPQLLRTTPERYPHLRLVFVESPNTRLDTQLATGQVDIAVLDLPTEGLDLAVTPLFEEELVLVVRRDHRLANARELSLHELEGTPLLLPLTGTAFRSDIDEAIKSTGATLLARAEVDGTRLIASLTFEGWGPSILPATAVPSYLLSDFALVKLTEIPRRLVGVVQRATGLPSAPARAVLELLTEIIADPSKIPNGLTPVQPQKRRLSGTARGAGIVQLSGGPEGLAPHEP